MTFFLIGPYYPFRGGIAQYISVLGQKLQERGHTVKVLSFKKQFPRFLFPGQTQIETSKDYIELDAQPIFIAWNPLTWLRTFLRIRRCKPDAVIFKYWMPFFAPGYGVICALTTWFTSVRSIYIIDNVIPHERRLADRFLTRFAFRWVRAFIVQSEVVRQELFRWFPEAKARKVELAPHPIYDCYASTDLSQAQARQKLGLGPQGKLLLFFGLVRRYKGLDVLLEAFSKLVARSGQGIHLLVAGEFYEPQEIYRKQVDSLGISDQVTIVNRYIPNEEVGIYFKAADLLVLPYRSATQSGVTQVAAHFRLPVVSTRVGGIPEVIRDGETGFLVPPEDADELARGIERALEEEVMGSVLDNLERRKGDYSWDNMIDVVEKLAGGSAD